jgi:hypothetical protein
MEDGGWVREGTEIAIDEEHVKLQCRWSTFLTCEQTEETYEEENEQGTHLTMISAGKWLKRGTAPRGMLSSRHTSKFGTRNEPEPSKYS